MPKIVADVTADTLWQRTNQVGYALISY